MVKAIALTHMKTNHIISIPIEILRELDMEEDRQVLIKVEDNKIVITKLEQK
ncbi:MAG: AbrB/MazE/SpoVT family DNA-binding domain-containing protein [Alphaproteobacteria bacterium]|nr:AbrB/MazE/SpoVT family DNA-binding domain-containing protein [Alphaproteobacteria bacterium]